MIIKTDLVKETPVSIGMFSRYGKVTTVVHPIFHEKRERPQAKATLENELYKRFLNQNDHHSKEKPTKTDESLEGSFYFRCVSREKSEPKRSKTPDLGRYRPKYESIEPKVIYFPTPKEKSTRARSNEQSMPNCVKHGSVCEFKARQLAKKIEILRNEINNSGADVEALYKSHLINKTTYNMFKSPSITLLKNIGEDKNEQADQDRSADIDIFDPLLQKSQGVITQMMNYYNLKEELKQLHQHNHDVLEKQRQTIPEKMRPKTPTPVPLNQQLTRPPLIKPESTVGSQIDLSGISEENNINRSFGRDPLRHTFNIGLHSRRRSLFINKDASLVFYDYDKFKISKADKNKPIPQFNKVPERQSKEPNTGSIADYGDLLKSFYQVAKRTGFSFDMRKTAKRKFSFPKESFSSTQQNSTMPKTPNTFYSVCRTPDVSFINNQTNKSFL